MFRGLTLTKDPYIHYHLLLVYVIDCEMMDDPDYQEQVLTPSQHDTHDTARTHRTTAHNDTRA